MLVPVISAKAQQGELVVDTMYYDTTDLEAQANIVYDNNNQPYALIKIEIPLENVKIEQNATVGKTVQKTGEVWVYVTADIDYGATNIVIQHSEYHALRVEFSDWGLDEIKGKCVYRLRVSVPSAALAEANRCYDNLRFKDAQDLYAEIVNNESSSEFERKFASIRLTKLPQLMSTNEVATLYAKRYINAVQEGAADKEYILCALDSASYWYKRLYQLSNIGISKTLADKFDSILVDKQQTRVIEGTVFYLQGQQGRFIKKSANNHKGIIVKHTGKKNEETLSVDTDDQGKFSIEYKIWKNDKLVFLYNDGTKEYKSDEIKPREDSKIVVYFKR